MKRFEMAELTLPERFGLMNSIVAPRPIAWVSTVDQQGVGNLAPFSYFNIGGSNPPSCVICPIADREGNPKDTLVNIAQSGEYVINVVTREMAEQVNQTSWPYPANVDELGAVGFHALPSELVAPPRVRESPIHLECRRYEIVRHGEGPLSSNYVIGEVLRVHAAEEVLSNGWPDNAKLQSLARLGGTYYAGVEASVLFELARPTGPGDENQ